MQTDWHRARNHYLAMTALALGLCILVAVVDPSIASAVALPVTFFAAHSAGAKFATLAGRQMHRDEVLTLVFIATALQVGVALAGLGLGLALETGEIVTVHMWAIAGLLVATALLALLVTWAGLRTGAFTILRKVKNPRIG